MSTNLRLRQYVDARLEALRMDRLSWWVHWSRISEVMLPRRYKWFITPNQYNRGTQMNAAIVDETAVIAARTCASGMLAGMTSPTRPWFRLGLHSMDEIPSGPVKNWLAEVQRRMMRVFAQSNFYQALGTLYHDNAVFCSAALIIYEDDEQVIRCYNPCLGEFFFVAGARMDVDGLYREFTLTVAQAVAQFGLENLPLTVQGMYRGGGAQLQTETIICHAIEPNVPIYAADAITPEPLPVPASFKYREVYWVKGTGEGHIVKTAGFKSKPFVGARWNTTSNDAYGSGPGMDAMPATLQLQIQQRRKAEAIDKLVRPPMVASVAMRNQPTSTLPGSTTYVADINANGYKAAYTVDPRLAEMVADIKEVQDRIKSVFFVDLFLMIAELDTVRTATEIDARREEKLIQLGPVIERFENEVLDPIIDRVFDIMNRRGLFPPPPPEIAGQLINVQYISMLAEAQRAASTSAIERLWQVIGNLVGIVPDIGDNVDWDVSVERYADYLQVDPEIIRAAAAVAQMRALKAKEQQAQAAAQASLATVQAAKTLSETDVGGGQNALQLMQGGGVPAGATLN